MRKYIAPEGLPVNEYCISEKKKKNMCDYLKMSVTCYKEAHVHRILECFILNETIDQNTYYFTVFMHIM